MKTKNENTQFSSRKLDPPKTKDGGLTSCPLYQTKKGVNTDIALFVQVSRRLASHYSPCYCHFIKREDFHNATPPDPPPVRRGGVNVQTPVGDMPTYLAVKRIIIMALLIKEWIAKETPNNAVYISIKDREGGLISWLLSLMGVDPTSTLSRT
jgi:hypothetical protein